MFSEKFNLGIKMFGSMHLLTLLALFVVAVLIILFNKRIMRNRVADRIIRYGVAFFAVTMEILYIIWSQFLLKKPIFDVLPLDLCAVTLWLTVLAVILKSEKLFRITFFWGTTGPILSLIVMQVQYIPPHFRFFHYFLVHFSTLLINVYMVATGRVKLRFKDSLLAVGILFCYSIVIFGLNKLWNTNYLYVNKLPPPLDLVCDKIGYIYLPIFGLVISASFQVFFWLSKGISKLSEAIIVKSKQSEIWAQG